MCPPCPLPLGCHVHIHVNADVHVHVQVCVHVHVRIHLVVYREIWEIAIVRDGARFKNKLMGVMVYF